MAAPREDADVETSSATYARRFSGPVGSWFLDVQAKSALELLRPWPGATVLDVGGGHGQLAHPLAGAGYSVTVLGSAPSCVEGLGNLHGVKGVRFLSGDLAALPFADRSFDVVLSFRLLTHALRWSALVGELARVAKRAVVIDYPSAISVNFLQGISYRMKRRLEPDTRPFRVFRERELQDAFAEHGFQRTARRPAYVFPMALHRLLGRVELARALEGAASSMGLTGILGSPVILRLERQEEVPGR